jgi:Flp pilus assembly pilin Flp
MGKIGMGKIGKAAARFWRNESGATAIEYSLIASAVFLGIVTPVATMKSKMNVTYQAILDYFTTVGV